MKLGKRDRRALMTLVGAALVVLALELIVAERGEAPAAAAAMDSVATAEKRLARVRRTAASWPAREADLKAVTEQLAGLEKGVIRADTLAQAQAQLLQVARRLTAAQAPPIEIRNVDLGQTRPLGDDYAEIAVPLSFECRVEQLVNLLADITAQPEFLAANGLRISSADPKDKIINVRLTLAGVVPRRLAPEKRGL